jgi:hypothetical protein
VNRDERRRLTRAGHTPAKPATKDDAKRFIDESFRDRIAWTAARVILERVTADPEYSKLDDELRGSVERFLERHPAGKTAGDPE